MTLLGKDGIVQLTRSFPDPVLLPPSALDIANNRFTINSDAFWPGDAVTLIHSGGTKVGFVWRDTLDRITLHTTAAGAQDNTVGTRVSLSGVPAAHSILCLTGAGAATTILTTLRTAIAEVSSETSLQVYPTGYTDYITANSGSTLWAFQGHIKKWDLKLGGNTTDTSAIGERFGDSIKTAITGSGSFDFLIQFSENSNGAHDIDQILRMALMIENNAKGKVKFYLKQRTTARTATIDGSSIVFLPGSVYYSADILLIDTSIDTTADDFIKGSSNFATTGPVRLFRE
jgi:hypothetical protein